jgi:hypothetical protein
MGRLPFGGQTWLYVNWLRGLHRLGHEVFYIEDDTVWPYDPVANTVTDDCTYAVRHVAEVMERIGLADRWAFRFADRPGAVWGMDDEAVDAVYRSSDALLNIVGATVLREPQLHAPFRVYVETDPVVAELQAAKGDAHTLRELGHYDVIATYGENYAAPDCLVPLGGRTYVKTRQPIDLDLWPAEYTPDARFFTTIGNYRQEVGDIELDGATYTWSKHHEWEKFMALPSLVDQEFELALIQVRDGDRERLRKAGWRLRSSFELSLDVFGAYPDYVRASRGEFTVAKDQNVRLRSGWFSERDACYLASAKPVVAQDTGFSNVLPTGEGLFGVATVEDAAAAVAAINDDYERHARAARELAEEYFECSRVAGALLADAGLM